MWSHKIVLAIILLLLTNIFRHYKTIVVAVTKIHDSESQGQEKQHACPPSSPCDHYGEYFTYTTTVKFANSVTYISPH